MCTLSGSILAWIDSLKIEGTRVVRMGTYTLNIHIGESSGQDI